MARSHKLFKGTDFIVKHVTVESYLAGVDGRTYAVFYTAGDELLRIPLFDTESRKRANACAKGLQETLDWAENENNVARWSASDDFI